MLGENHGRFPWRYAVALIIACGFAALLVLPYEIEVQRLNAVPEGALVWKPEKFAVEVHHKDKRYPDYHWGPGLVIGAVVDRMLWPLLAIFLGLKLGPALGLAWPPLAGWGAGPRRVRRVSSTLLLAVALGVASVIWLFGPLLLLQSGFGDQAGRVVQPAWWVGLLASLGAGVREEVWFRLGVVTTIVWVLAKLTRRRAAGPAMIWAGIVLASLLFGAMHLQQATELAGGTGAGCDLRLMSSVNDVSGIPTVGKNLIIVAAVDKVLHFRVFDPDGKVVVDIDEKSLTAKVRQIEDLRKQLAALWPPHELSGNEKDRLIIAVTSVVGHTPGAVIAFVLLGNGGIALIFGWLYWRKGLIAAMTAHTTQDVITKAIIPLILTS
jgi:membrane protease YdiL (CAAX protease family)